MKCTGHDDTFVVELQMEKVAMSKAPLFMYFVLDASASMDANERLTSMQKTLTKMWQYLMDHHQTEVYVRLDAFHIDVTTIIPTTRLFPTTMEDMCYKLWSLETRHYTNFEVALRNSAAVLHEYSVSHPSHRIVHFFITDGDANEGVTDPETLADILSLGTRKRPMYHFFLGIDFQHNSLILRCCAERPYSEYHFIDDLENSGLVFGEIFHKILHPVAEGMQMTVLQPGWTVFDWQSNTWSKICTDLHIVDDDLVKRFFVRRSDSKFPWIAFHVEWRGGNEGEEDLVVLEPNVDDDSAMPYYFQLQLMQLFFQMRSTTHNNVGLLSEGRALQGRLVQVRKLRMPTDPVSQQLASLQTDLAMALKDLGTPLGCMFCTTRLFCWGSQQSYLPPIVKQRLASSTVSSENTSPGRRRMMSIF